MNPLSHLIESAQAMLGLAGPSVETLALERAGWPAATGIILLLGDWGWRSCQNIRRGAVQLAAAFRQHTIGSLRGKAVFSLIFTAAASGTVVWAMSEQGPPPDSDTVMEPPALVVQTPGPVSGAQADGVGAGTVVLRVPPNLPSDAAIQPLVARLLKAGVTHVWVQFKQDETDEFQGGTVFYPSKIAPVASGFEEGRLGKFIDTLREAGVRVSAWVPAFHDPVAWTRHPEWRSQAIAESGETVEQRNWLCPRNAGAVAYEASILGEIARVFHGRIQGIYTDFIRYDTDYSCACSGCMTELTARVGGNGVNGKRLRAAMESEEVLWTHWVNLRGDAIRDVLNVMRDAISLSSPNLWFGASVLPFSASDYHFNTQSGQDLEKMCLAGIDEIVLMGYWDDWDKSPGWLAGSIRMAHRIVEGEARLSCLLDGDMTVHRTMRTLDEIAGIPCDIGWFNYGAWTDQWLDVPRRAFTQLAVHHGMPRSRFTAVTIRIDTEPDADLSYEKVHPEMIQTLLDLFEQEQVPATFITVGRLANQQPDILRKAVAMGHEIGGHAWDHEQIDSLPENAQKQVIDRTTDALRTLKFQPSSFGAPRNSITSAAQDRLIERGWFCDGSAAYDPMTSWMDPSLVTHSKNPEKAMVLVPFIMPNDWDARYLFKVSAPKMQAMWEERLARVAEEGDPCFVLDIHQWIASQPDNLEAVRGFIRAVKARKDCRIMTLHQTACHVLEELRRAEEGAPASAALTCNPIHP